MFKKLAQKLIEERKSHSGNIINPIDVDFDNRKNSFLKKLSRNAVDMYEKKQDIKKFSKLVLSDFENTSHNEIVDQLFSDGIIDPFEDEKLLKLSDNKRFLRDLGLIDEDF